MLTDRFNHKHWFKGQRITEQQFLDYVLDHFGDFHIKTKNKLKDNNLLDNPITEYYLSDNKYSYKLNNDECNYLSAHNEYFQNKLN